MGQTDLATLIAKDEIRELAHLYARGVDRKHFALLRPLYATDAYDDHGDFFRGTAADYVDYLESTSPGLYYSGHHVCNHLISVDGDEGEGEVYSLNFHMVADVKGDMWERIGVSRYIDKYRKEGGRWRFSLRVLNVDYRSARQIPRRDGPAPSPLADPSVTALVSRLFRRGDRA